MLLATPTCCAVLSRFSLSCRAGVACGDARRGPRRRRGAPSSAPDDFSPSMLAANRAVAAQVSVQPLATSVEWARRMVRRTQTGVDRSCAGCRARCELVESRMQRCVAIVWTRAGLPHDGCVDCDVCEYSVVDGLARYIVRILSYRRLTPQICTRSREILCTRPTLAGTPIYYRVRVQRLVTAVECGSTE